jgi:hypothetical protein
MIFSRKKIKCTVTPAPNPDSMQFFFHGDHWSYFFPDINRILEKGLKPCRWKNVSEGMMTYSIATDEYHHTLLCEDGDVNVHDDNYGLSVFVKCKDEALFRRVQKVLGGSGRFELVFCDLYKRDAEPNEEDAPDPKAVR